MMITPEDFNQATTENFEQSLSQSQEQQYLLRLYIAGTNLQSVNALQNIKKICDQYLPERYQLEVIDIYQQPELVVSKNLTAIPTLIKELPLPLQKLIGNLSNTEKVLVGLDIFPKTIAREKNNEQFPESS